MIFHGEVVEVDGVRVVVEWPVGRPESAVVSHAGSLPSLPRTVPEDVEQAAFAAAGERRKEEAPGLKKADRDAKDRRDNLRRLEGKK